MNKVPRRIDGWIDGHLGFYPKRSAFYKSWVGALKGADALCSELDCAARLCKKTSKNPPQEFVAVLHDLNFDTFKYYKRNKHLTWVLEKMTHGNEHDELFRSWELKQRLLP
jgi:hypothetical protein